MIDYLRIYFAIFGLWPNINYKVNDNFAVEVGANIFFGDYPSTFFGRVSLMTTDMIESLHDAFLKNK